jgi:hypothetical protein
VSPPYEDYPGFALLNGCGEKFQIFMPVSTYGEYWLAYFPNCQQKANDSLRSR